jgi:hypothetical protein
MEPPQHSGKTKRGRVGLRPSPEPAPSFVSLSPFRGAYEDPVPASPPSSRERHARGDAKLRLKMCNRYLPAGQGGDLSPDPQNSDSTSAPKGGPPRKTMLHVFALQLQEAEAQIKQLEQEIAEKDSIICNLRSDIRDLEEVGDDLKSENEALKLLCEGKDLSKSELREEIERQRRSRLEVEKLSAEQSAYADYLRRRVDFLEKRINMAKRADLAIRQQERERCIRVIEDLFGESYLWTPARFIIKKLRELK